jgi:negative regulator of flagellin synthesis FlgM
VKVDSSTRNSVALTQGDSTGAASAGATSSAAAASNTSGAGAASTSGASQGDASVSLSSLSSSLRSLAASGSADIDTAHVESIKAAIRNGTLQIDAGKIADGVIETARSLMKPASGN